MSRTYRALAIVAVVVTVADLVAAVTFDPGRAGGWFSYAPLSSSSNGLVAALLDDVWLTTATIAPPIVSTFGAIVAAQKCHWVWLGAFIALGVLGIYGGSALDLLEVYLDLGQVSNPLTVGNLFAYIAQALPAVAALLFVATTSRPARIRNEQANTVASEAK